MVRTYHRTTSKGADQGNTYSRETLELALADVKNGNRTQRGAAEFHGIPRSTLRHYLDGSRGSGCISKDGTGGGGKLAIPPKYELQLADCLRTLEKWGFGLSREEVMDLVQEFVQQNNLKTRFKDGRPGPDWFIAFKNRHKLSIKMPQGVEYVRLSQENPFVINGLFDLLEKTIDENGLTNKPHLIFNCDESGFGHDPSKTKVVGGKGVKCTRTISSAGRENTTVLVSCSAAGGKLPLLCVFKGKNVMESWVDKESDARTGYAASKSGWMDSEIFYNWFQKVFLPNIPEERPIILILDGHKSHVNLPLILKAVEHQIILFKLPPHTTHITQPLDVGVFKGLKSDWDKNLTKWQRQNPRKRIPKQEFVNILVSSFLEVNEQNVKNAFKASGLYDEETGKPNRQEAIKRCKFKPYELEAYNKSQQKKDANNNKVPEIQVQADENPFVAENNNNSINAQTNGDKIPDTLDVVTNNIPDTDKNTENTGNQVNADEKLFVHGEIDNSTNAATDNDMIHDILDIIANDIPDIDKNTENVFHFQVEDNNALMVHEDANKINDVQIASAPASSIQITNEKVKRSFEEIIVQMFHRNKSVEDSSKEAPKPKRKKISSGAEIITASEYIEQKQEDKRKEELALQEKNKRAEKKLVKKQREEEDRIDGKLKKKERNQKLLKSKKKNIQKKKIKTDFKTSRPILDDSDDDTSDDSATAMNVQDLALQEKNKRTEKKLLKKQREEEERIDGKLKKKERNQKLLKCEKKNIQKKKIKTDFETNRPILDDSDDDTSDDSATAMSVQDSESDENVPSITVVKGDFVIVTYNGTKYPGQVDDIDGDQVKVKHMKSAGLTYWRWPEEEDILWYEEQDILKLIRPPIPMNKRGVFSVPELKGCFFEYE